ncbi:spore cortex biosynthesis protein YabQ [Melghirimyces profundicolus]|uniref:Spore cortex biosynthesis protein YabQ n=1 Tax=Melghirimyces profundicolus TaxID=1242148 RepID=A0A2T6BGR3_9BACL|nr:spore cortex biosynthesis protein YabQ [Melghirimyces profundicolus]PTX55249.1 spore cortex biosynthesis protein YabQ [Melghirimyces profundicolus]
MTLHTQWVTMGLMLGSGCLMGMMLDLYRVLSGRFRFKGWAISLVDLLYWTVAAGLVFSLLMWSNWGELRFYIFIAILAGWMTYHTWFSRAVSRGMEWGVDTLGRIFRFCVRMFRMLVWIPLRGLWTLVVRILGWILRILRMFLSIPVRLILAPLGRWLQPCGLRLKQRYAPVFRPVFRMVRALRRWFSGKGDGGDG